MRCRLGLRLLLSTAFAAFSGAGYAASDGAGPAEFTPARTQNAQAGEAPHGLEEIVVTARRREENLQQVPLSITALSGAVVKEREVKLIDDLQYLVPSFGMNTNAGRGTSQGLIRGVRFGALTYFNQIASNYRTNSSSPQSPPLRYFDLENIQVLKGPQGTLFGGTAIGGAVLIEPAKPTNRLEGYAEATLGNYKRHDLEAVINVPVVSDKVLLRVGASLLRRRGITRDVVHEEWIDSAHSNHYRASLTVKPAETIENRTVFQLSDIDQREASYKLVGYNPGFVTATLFPTLAAEIVRQNALGPYAIAPGPLARSRLDAAYWHFSDILSWDVLDTLTVKNIFGWTRIRRRTSYDPDGSSLGILDTIPTEADGSDTRADTKSEEFQLQGNMLDRTLAWTAGYYWSFTQPYGNVGQRVQTTLGTTSAGLLRTQAKDRAWFLHAEYDLSQWLSGVKIAGGYRQSRSRFSTVTSSWRATPDPAGIAAATRGVCTAARADAECRVESANPTKGSGYTFSANYTFNPDKLVYFKTSKAYNPGGINFTVADLANPFRQFASETVTDYELGLKADWRLAGMAARTNLDVFEAHYDNLVVTTGVLINGVSTSVSLNGGNLRTRGIEFEGTLLPLDGLELTAGYAYLMPLMRKVVPNTAGITLESPAPAAPRHKFIGSAKYRLPLPEEIGAVDVQGTITAQTRSAVALNFDPFVQYFKPLTLLGARIDWRDIMGYPIDLGFSVTNLTDKRYYDGALPTYTSVGISAVLWAEPRMWRATLRYRFGSSD